MSYLVRFLLAQLNDFFSGRLTRHPSIGYVAAATSTTTGLFSMIDGATKVLGLGSVLIGIVVGLYTLRIQRRTWEQGQKRPEP